MTTRSDLLIEDQSADCVWDFINTLAAANLLAKKETVAFAALLLRKVRSI